jgi:hypothetical protein
MTEDELVHLLKQKWGVREEPPEPAIVVRLRPLLRTLSISSQTVGSLRTVALLMGEGGERLLVESDRLERGLRYEVSDLVV